MPRRIGARDFHHELLVGRVKTGERTYWLRPVLEFRSPALFVRPTAMTLGQTMADAEELA
jgi:hypothetical protein